MQDPTHTKKKKKKEREREENKKPDEPLSSGCVEHECMRDSPPFILV
jgi:hypothetical protein